MATTISTNGRKKLITFQKEFREKFSHLNIYFHEVKFKDGRYRQSHYISNKKTFSEVRLKKGANNISISGNKLVHNLENEFIEFFGIGVCISYLTKDGYWCDVTEVTGKSKYSLYELNKKGQEGGKTPSKIMPS